MSTDYRHTDKQLRLVIGAVALCCSQESAHKQRDRQTDGQTLPSTLSFNFMVDNNYGKASKLRWVSYPHPPPSILTGEFHPYVSWCMCRAGTPDRLILYDGFSNPIHRFTDIMWENYMRHIETRGSNFFGLLVIWTSVSVWVPISAIPNGQTPSCLYLNIVKIELFTRDLMQWCANPGISNPDPNPGVSNPNPHKSESTSFFLNPNPNLNPTASNPNPDSNPTQSM